MKWVLTTIAAVAALASGPVNAADIPVKAPPMPAMATYSWTGLYIGGEGGGVWRGHYDWAPEFPSIHGGLDGGFGGGTIGWNWQPNKYIVIGVEGDWSWADIKGDMVGGSCSVNFSCSAKIESFGTARARFGIVGW